MLTPSRSTGDHPTINGLFGGVLAGWIASLYETPVPQDWVGLANQVHHQMSGGASYLLGESADDRLEILLFRGARGEAAPDLLAAAGRPASRWPGGEREATGPATFSCPWRSVSSWPSPQSVDAQLWIRVPGSPGAAGDRLDLADRPGRARLVGDRGGMATLADRAGPRGAGSGHRGRSSLRADLLQRSGRWSARRAHILSDSNLDWGQGLKCLARL